MKQDVGIYNRSAKAGKQGRDDSIKHLNAQLQIPLLKICRVGLYVYNQLV